MTAMMWAAYRGHKEIVSLLIERGGNMDLKTKVRLYHPLPPHLPPFWSNYKSSFIILLMPKLPVSLGMTFVNNT